jgi:hypothetical protein
MPFASPPVPIAAMREGHVPQMCLYVPSSMRSELALVAVDDGTGSLDNGNGGSPAGGGVLGIGLPFGPTISIPGTGDVPVEAIVAFLAMMVLAIVAAKASVKERRRQPAFLSVPRRPR